MLAAQDDESAGSGFPSDPDSLSAGQRAYVAEFERFLRTPPGIDVALELADRIGVRLVGRNEMHRRTLRLKDE